VWGVGPASAGATPGASCYGRGGKLPTIAGANMWLGRLDTSRLDAVEGGVSLDDVEAVFQRELGDPLGIDAVKAAAAVVRVANAKMAGAIRMVSVSLGADPRDFALFAFGGAGPLHAAALARELGVPKVLIPVRPGVTNALGCVLADLRHDFVNTLNRPVNELDPQIVADVFADQIARGDALLDRETIDIRSRRYIHSVDMQFVGQSHVLRVPLDAPISDSTALRARFEGVYHNRFGIVLPDIRANLVNVNTSVIGERTQLDLSTLIDPDKRMATLEQAQAGTRSVFFDTDWIETKIYHRDQLPMSFEMHGPAIIVQMVTTILIEPIHVARGD